jgi:phospholipid/cholesterol/gamma-HCH transport system ATP-binding protein
VAEDSSFGVAPALPAIELIDIHIALGGAPVLGGLSLAAPRGRITVLLGPSGVGKTTCLRLITGLLIPDAGDVIVDGHSTLAMTKRRRLELSRRFGVLLQGSGLYGSALWESMTVEQNLLHQLRAQRGGREPELRERAREWLAAVGLSASAELPPATLSSGMRRRLALARALIADPEYAVLDSLELGADPVRLGELIRIVARTHERTGGTFVIATQSIELARRVADEIVVLWGGRVLEQGPAERVLASERPEVRQLLDGLVDGPLGMDDEPGAVARPVPVARYIEAGFELPVPVVAAAVLVVVTASALWLGHGGVVELALVAALWVIAAAVVAARRR